MCHMIVGRSRLRSLLLDYCLASLWGWRIYCCRNLSRSTKATRCNRLNWSWGCRSRSFSHLVTRPPALAYQDRWWSRRLQGSMECREPSRTHRRSEVHRACLGCWGRKVPRERQELHSFHRSGVDLAYPGCLVQKVFQEHWERHSSNHSEAGRAYRDYQVQ